MDQYAVVVGAGALRSDGPRAVPLLTALLARVDEVAEIPRAIRAGGPVRRV